MLYNYFPLKYIFIFISSCFATKIYAQSSLTECTNSYNNAIQLYIQNKDSSEIKELLHKENEIWKRCLIEKNFPQLELVDMKGTKYHIDSISNKVFIIQFWMKWCPPCMSEIPILNRLANDFKSANVQFITISYNKFIDASILHQFHLPVIPDMADNIQKLGVLAYPTIYIISPKLKIKFVTQGADIDDINQIYTTLSNQIKHLLSNK